MIKDIDIGTKRINSASLKLCIKTSTSWDYLDELSEDLNSIISQYSKNKTLHYLIDEKHPEFLKGSLSPENKIFIMNAVDYLIGDRDLIEVFLLKTKSREKGSNYCLKELN